jgi:mono/diheme cytochrome c family protein
MRGLFAGCTVVAIGLIAVQLSPVGAQEDASKPEYYTAKVKPIFETSCGECHMNGKRKGGFVLDTRAGLMKGGKDGSVVIPGDPANSLLIKLIRHEGPEDDPMPMPPKTKISDAEIAIVTAWVKAGAVMPPDPPKE